MAQMTINNLYQYVKAKITILVQQDHGATQRWCLQCILVCVQTRNLELTWATITLLKLLFNKVEQEKDKKNSMHVKRKWEWKHNNLLSKGKNIFF